MADRLLEKMMEMMARVTVESDVALIPCYLREREKEGKEGLIPPAAWIARSIEAGFLDRVESQRQGLLCPKQGF